MQQDKRQLSKHQSEQDYGDSWKKRGGIGAFMMLARKWDRIENQVNDSNYDIFLALEEDGRQEGLIDDIRDLRRYLLLVEAEMALQNDEQYANIFSTEREESNA